MNTGISKQSTKSHWSHHKSELKKLPFLTQFFGMLQVTVGLCCILYMGVVMVHVESIAGLIFTERQALAGQFLYYCGGGFCHAFTGSTILARHEAAPTLAVVVALWTLAFNFHSLITEPAMMVQSLSFICVTLIYLIWFAAKYHDFEKTNAK